MMWNCLNCKTDNVDSSMYCIKCDTPSTMYVNKDNNSRELKENVYSFALLLRASPIVLLVFVLAWLALEKVLN